MRLTAEWRWGAWRRLRMDADLAVPLLSLQSFARKVRARLDPSRWELRP